MYRPDNNDLYYMAGLFDGEGYISIRKQVQHDKYECYSLMVGINMVDEEPIKLFRKAFGGKIKLRNGGGDNWKPQYRWRLEASSAYHCIEVLYPYLRLKSDKAKLALAFQENKKTYNYRPQGEKDIEATIFSNMRELNRRGINAI